MPLAMRFLVSFALGPLLAFGIRRKARVNNDVSTAGIIVGSNSRFKGAAGRGGGMMGMGDLSVGNLDTAFTYSFKPGMDHCAATPDAHIEIKDYAGNNPRMFKALPESMEAVDYWDGYSHREKFIGGGLRGCGENTNMRMVCHVMMKLTLVPDSGEGGKEEFYVVGQLSKGGMKSGQHGSTWTHYSSFSLVPAGMLQPAAEAGFNLKAKVDPHQMLPWSCVEPDEPDVGIEDFRAAASVVRSMQRATLVFEMRESAAIESGAPSRCCCVERDGKVLAMAVHIPFAVGHSGLHAGTKDAQSCPVIAVRKEHPSEVCGCTTKHMGLHWVAESKCEEESADHDFVGEPSHSPSKMDSESAQAACLAKCVMGEEDAAEYAATVASACED